MAERKRVIIPSLRSGANHRDDSWKGTNPSGSLRKSAVDRESKQQYTEYVPVSIEPDALLVQLNKLLAASGLSRTVARAELEKILEICSTPSIGSLPFIDPVTDLQIPPPPPAETFSKHWDRLSKRYTPEEFLATYWSKYTSDHPHMLFVSHLRDHDGNLVSALRARASALNEDIDSFFFCHGVLTQAHVFGNCPDSAKRQAKLFKALISYRRFEKMKSDIPFHR